MPQKKRITKTNICVGKRGACLTPFIFLTSRHTCHRADSAGRKKDRARDQWEAFTQSKERRQLVVPAGVSGKPRNPKQALNNISCQPTAPLLLLYICCTSQDFMLQRFVSAHTLTAHKKIISSSVNIVVFFYITTALKKKDCFLG